MDVPDPWRERVQLRLVQVEPQLDGPGLDQVAVWVVVPLEDVADAVGADDGAVLPREAFDNIALGVEGLNQDRSSRRVGIDLDFVSDEDECLSDERSFVVSVD